MVSQTPDFAETTTEESYHLIQNLFGFNNFGLTLSAENGNRPDGSIPLWMRAVRDLLDPAEIEFSGLIPKGEELIRVRPVDVFIDSPKIVPGFRIELRRLSSVDENLFDDYVLSLVTEEPEEDEIFCQIEISSEKIAAKTMSVPCLNMTSSILSDSIMLAILTLRQYKWQQAMIKK